MLRNGLLHLADSDTVRDLVERAPVSRSVVRRFVPGAGTPDAVGAARGLTGTGRLVTVDYLGEDTTDLAHAQHTRDAYLALLAALAEEGLTGGGAVEVSLKLSAVGQALPDDGHRSPWSMPARSVRPRPRRARRSPSTWRTTPPPTPPSRRCRRCAPTSPTSARCCRRTCGAPRPTAPTSPATGSRVRLCKGAYNEPDSVAYQGSDVDRAYVRCLKVLMAGKGYPMVASHDPRLVEIAGALAAKHGRDPRSFEYQMLYGIRPEEQQRIADRGDQMRVYIPYGEQWYGYLMRRMAEKPANLAFFLRGVATRG